ncbi:MAG: hypothetical protein WCS33_00315 [Candidatus Caldatribacteriota bacterium]
MNKKGYTIITLSDAGKVIEVELLELQKGDMLILQMHPDVPVGLAMEWHKGVVESLNRGDTVLTKSDKMRLGVNRQKGG